MKLENTFNELERLVARMGATPSSWKPGFDSLEPIERIRRELAEGKEITLEAVRSAHGGLLTHEGEQVLLYIKDTRKDRDTLLYDLENAPKFHIAECRTLDRMRREGRFERYVVTNETSGEFAVEATDYHTREVEDITAALYVCKNCLSTLDWKLYNGRSLGEKNKIRDDFSLDDFFAEFATFFQSKPRHTDKSAPRGGYAKDWSQRSETFREQRHWRCDLCGVDLNENHSLLHCHHENGVVSDNKPDNIKVLCIVCHWEQPAHGHLKPKLKHRLLIERLRRQQKPSARSTKRRIWSRKQ